MHVDCFVLFCSVSILNDDKRRELSYLYHLNGQFDFVLLCKKMRLYLRMENSDTPSIGEQSGCTIILLLSSSLFRRIAHLYCINKALAPMIITFCNGN